MEESNSDLRAILISAGREIKKLNFGKTDSALLRKIREVPEKRTT